MQVIKSFFRLCWFLFPGVIYAQTTYIPQGDKAYEIINRVEIKESQNKALNFSSIKPYSRKKIVQEFQTLYSDSSSNRFLKFSTVDKHNIESILINNTEWVTDSLLFTSKRIFLNDLYVTPSTLFQVHTKDFILAINPIINYQRSYGSVLDKGAFLNTRGVTARGLIANSVGFSTTITDNQEQGPYYFNERINKYHQVPGVGFYKTFKTTGYDYFDARGYFTINISKLVDVQFGYDNNFIGNGYRSLFLSDYANSYLFLKLNATKGRFNYQTIFAELIPQFIKSSDTLLDRKYAAFHHLSYNVTKNFNVGLFEGVVFGNKNEFNVRYLNPVIFVRHIERYKNSTDNAIGGVDAKLNLIHCVQLYGQLLLDEFDFRNAVKNNGYWANKVGYQLGIKYIDAVSIKNLDIQFETNRVRPFTYAFDNPIANYSHYNLPLAHPLGANFQEYIGILDYQPFNKWRLHARVIYYKQGLDSLDTNSGSNIFENTLSRTRDFAYHTQGGNKVSCFNGALSVSYELKENLYVELDFLYRKYSAQIIPAENNSKLISLGIRFNIFKRPYDL